MTTSIITVNGTDLSEWKTPEEARRAMHVLECIMNMGGRLIGKVAIGSSDDHLHEHEGVRH